MKLISCIDAEGGIGKNGTLPWYIKEDLQMFKKETLNKKVLFGRKTAENLPTLPKREIFVLSHERRGYFAFGNNLVTFIGDDEATSDMIICGGTEVYKHFLEKNMVTSAILGRISKSYDCDTFFPFKLLEEKLRNTINLRYFDMVTNIEPNYFIEIWG